MPRQIGRWKHARRTARGQVCKHVARHVRLAYVARRRAYVASFGGAKSLDGHSMDEIVRSLRALGLLA
jgi:hypothetical protein